MTSICEFKSTRTVNFNYKDYYSAILLYYSVVEGCFLLIELLITIANMCILSLAIKGWHKYSFTFLTITHSNRYRIISIILFLIMLFHRGKTLWDRISSNILTFCTPQFFPYGKIAIRRVSSTKSTIFLNQWIRYSTYCCVTLNLIY